MQHTTATTMQHGSLKTLADKVLERNAVARHACNTGTDEVLHGGIAQGGPMQLPCNTPERSESVKAGGWPTRSEDTTPLGSGLGPNCPGHDKCAGCYSVGVLDGRERFIHPPVASAEWEVWLKRWEPRGRIQ